MVPNPMVEACFYMKPRANLEPHFAFQDMPTMHKQSTIE